MKKKLVLLLTAVCVLSLSACVDSASAGGSQNGGANTIVTVNEGGNSAADAGSSAADITSSDSGAGSTESEVYESAEEAGSVSEESTSAKLTGLGNSHYPMAITSSADLKSVENDLFAAKFEGSAEELEDSVFVDGYGEDAIYYVWKGFDEDGYKDEIWGYNRTFYFFSDKETYQAAVARAESHSQLKERDDEHLIMTVPAYRVDAETWEEMKETFDAGEDYSYDKFFTVE